MFNKNQSRNIFLFGLIFFIADRILKYLFINNFFPSKTFFITYLKNYGIAFGLDLPKSFLFIFYFLVIIIILALVYYLIKYYQQKKYLVLFSLWFILLGALSNILDRLKFGFVIDFIDFYIWPVFNIADMMIVGGIIILALNYYKLNKHEH